MAALEDAGFYCIDNMPVGLLPKFLEMPMEPDSAITGIVLVMDLRERRFLAEYSSVFNALKQKGYHFEILFLEAEEEILLQRYSTTRRQHPLSPEKNLLDGIRTEKKQLEDLRSAADLVITPPSSMFMSSNPRFSKSLKEVKNLCRCRLMYFLSATSMASLMMPT